MRRSIKTSLLRSSAIATVVAIGFGGLITPAGAVIVGNPQPESVTDLGNGSCNVRIRYDRTGQVNDNSNNDSYAVGVRNTSTGQIPGSVGFRGVPVGTTEVQALDSRAFSDTGRGGREFVIFEVVGNTVAQELLAFPISRASLIAAGGACSQLAPNSAPVANAGPDVSFNTTSASGVVIPVDAANSTDADNDPLTYAWTQVSGPQATITSANQILASISFPTLVGPTDFEFQVLVTDVAGDTSTDIVRISLTPPNSVPTVDAGPDQNVAGGSAVSLSGTASDADNDPLTFQWTQTGGPAVTLSGDTTLNPTFTAPPRTLNAQTLTFELAANDGSATTTDSVTITVAANLAPIAEAGQPQTVAGGSPVNLDGTGSSDPEYDPLVYNWTQVSGPSVILTGANTATPTFTAPARTNSAQTLEFEVRVTDTFDATDTDRVIITIPANQLPLADAGPDQTLAGGSNVTLDGSGSTDPEGDPIEYSWVQTGGPSVTLTNSNSVSPTFVAPQGTNANQVLTFQLTVTDTIGSGSSGARIAPSNPQQDTVQITILANNVPLADAGQPQTVAGGAAVTLDGSGSTDPDGDPLTYNWVQTGGTAVTVTNANTASPTFTAPPKTNSAQTLTFELTVNDPSGASSTAEVTITVAANQLPLADAGPDQSVNGTSTVTLDGSGSSDPDGDAINYSWVQTGGPAVSLLNSTSVSPTFVAPTAIASTQTLTFQLTVDDGVGSGGGGASTERIAINPQQDTVEITILANSPPVADAGADQGPIDAGQVVTLDGSGSTDPDGDTLGFTWTQVSGTPVTLTGGSTAAPTFVAPVVNGNEDLVFSLIVDDGQAQSAADTVTISVRAVGSVTIIQRVIGGDAAVTFTSDIAALNGSVTTSGGTAQVSAVEIPTGSYSVSVNDIRTAGFALTDITCNDGDSVASVANRSVALELSPGEDLVCTFTSTNSRGAAQAAIADFLTGRNALIMSHQPDLQRRLDRLTGTPAQGGNATAFGVPIPGSASLPFALSLASGQASASTSLAQIAATLDPQDRSDRLFDIWGEAFFSRAQLGSQKANFRIIHIGADYRIGDDVLIGALAEFDDFDDRGTLEAGEAEGNGFLFGPYLMARIAPDLFAELRAAWGSSDNRVNPLGTFTDTFDTSRSYYSGSLVGQFDIGKRTQVRPEVTVRYLDETQQAYTDSLGVVIPEQSIAQGDVSFRPRLQHVIELRSGWTLRPFMEAEGIYTFGTEANTVLDNGLRARVEGGLDVLSSNGFRASVGAFHDGIGADNFESTGVHVSVSFGF